jgi:hypothetical protein
MPADREVIKNAFIEIDGTELSNQGNKITLKREKEVMDATGYRAKSKQKATGIPDSAIEMTLFMSYGEGGLDSVLEPIFEDDKEVEVVIKFKKGPASADNPKYTMTGILPSYPLSSDGPGQLQTVDVTFENTGEDGIVPSHTPAEGEAE